MNNIERRNNGLAYIADESVLEEMKVPQPSAKAEQYRLD